MWITGRLVAERRPLGAVLLFECGRLLLGPQARCASYGRRWFEVRPHPRPDAGLRRNPDGAVDEPVEEVRHQPTASR
jgi:hypothetical protein